MAKVDVLKWTKEDGTTELYRFHQDVKNKDIDAIGVQPTDPGNIKAITEYQHKLLCCLSADPKLIVAELDEMPSKKLAWLMAKVVVKYNMEIEAFLPPEVLEVARQRMALLNQPKKPQS